jgi:hypothetical protein
MKSLAGRLPVCSADTFAVIAGLCAKIRALLELEPR